MSVYSCNACAYHSVEPFGDEPCPNCVIIAAAADAPPPGKAEFTVLGATPDDADDLEERIVADSVARMTAKAARSAHAKRSAELPQACFVTDEPLMIELIKDSDDRVQHAVDKVCKLIRECRASGKQPPARVSFPAAKALGAATYVDMKGSDDEPIGTMVGTLEQMFEISFEIVQWGGVYWARPWIRGVRPVVPDGGDGGPPDGTWRKAWDDQVKRNGWLFPVRWWRKLRSRYAEREFRSQLRTAAAIRQEAFGDIGEASAGGDDGALRTARGFFGGAEDDASERRA